jgi:ubiquinone biosynthesis protein
MIKTLLVAGRDRDRLAEILRVASRFGLGILLARLGLERGEGNDEDADEPQSLPRRTRLALEALGPTFVKLGQILATRGDLLPPEWIAELETLHSSAPTLPFEALRPIVEEALGQPPETAFAHFETTPLAAASMAQVHRATLPDGRPVVLKIRRPGIRPRMEADLRLIAQLASIVEGASAEARRFAPGALMRQLAEAVLEELDFTIEGRNADRLRADFSREPRVVVPEIHWAWTSETLLVMDYIDGLPPRDGAMLRAAGIDPAAIAELGADIVLDMVLVNGRFHGDPHPGNLLCLPGDPAQLADVLAGWSAGSGVSPERVQAAAERLIARHGGDRLVLSAMVADFMALMRHEGMTLPPDLLLIFKALITLDGVLSAIEPDFDLSRAMRRSSLRIAQARLAQEHWAPILQALAWELGRIGGDAPRLIRAAIRRLETDPAADATPAPGQVAATVSAVRWLAGAVLIGAMLIAGAMFLA